jgi:ribose-phosphate pyrophosphokinase
MTGGPVAFLLPGFGPVLDPPRAGAEVGAFERGRFANGELHVHLATPVARRQCIVVGSVAPPDTQLVELLLLCDTLSRHGAANIQVVLPYLAYARQDRLQSGAGLAIAWLGGALRAAGVNDVVTIDAHSDAALRLLGCHVRPLPSTGVLADALRTEELGRDAVVVAPDGGAIGRAEALAAELGATSAWVDKRRTSDGVEHGRITGRLGSTAIVVDDILDTGATLISCSRLLRAAGVQRLLVAVTHGLFTGERWRELLTFAPIIHVTDTLPLVRDQASEAIRVHPVGELLEDALRASGEPPAARGSIVAERSTS